MRKTRYVVWIVALITLGSGLLNLYSVTRRISPYSRVLLREIFPLDFIRLSRLLTLLIGFALIVSSINIYKRKKRAFQIVAFLAGLSVVFHLTKGLEYREALFSLLLLVFLIVSRKNFNVRSSIPDFQGALVRMGIVAAAAFGYAVFGFWLLDKRDFGVDFTLPDSIHRSLLFFSLVGDPKIVPHTRHARWFIGSLYLMTATAAGYSAFALYRPVVYKYRTLPRERNHAKELLDRYGRSSLDFFKLWPDKSYFFSPSQSCVIAYRVEANVAIALADPVGPEDQLSEAVRSFVELCKENDWACVFHQTLPDFLPLYESLGFRKLKIGDEGIVDLKDFTLGGRRMKRLRNNAHQLAKSGIHSVYYEPPTPEHVLAQAKEVSDDWLQIPGRRERSFTLGRFDANYLRTTALFCVVDQSDRMLAFVNLIPSYRPGEATFDLMRHGTAAPKGTMDYLFVKLLEFNRQQGYERFNLGMAPVGGFQEHEQPSAEERAVHFFLQRLNFLFSYEGLRLHKAKFASFWEPRYCIYKSVRQLPKIAIALARVTESSS
ncbi:MAG: phosphatidylglycerol lysyltransferase domain-containing protein [Pyrinomonadaceae bacterium]